MGTPSYDAYQQVFSLSLLANAAAMNQGSQAALGQQLANDLAANLGAAQLQALIGDWSVVWGPAVWQRAGSKVLDNAMYVAHNPAVTFPDGSVRDTYVVAIAATNPQSAYDWFVEDFAVSKTVQLSTFNPFEAAPVASSPTLTEPFISWATAIGIYQLAQLVAPTGAPGAGTNIAQFLQGLSGVDASTLVFAGHSLAGALSPTLALWLKTNGMMGSFGTAYVYPTAGATPGNTAFALDYATHFWPTKAGAQPYQQWNKMLWNTLDIVPHAWNVVDLNAIKTLYDNAPITVLSLAVDGAIANSLLSSSVYVRVQNSSLPGTLASENPFTNPPAPMVVPPTTIQQFLPQAAYQHVDAYYGLIAGPLPKVDVPLVPGVTKVTAGQVLAEIIGWLLSHFKA